MKTLVLVRHAKSSWKHTDLRDLDRPLNKRGKHDAPLMAAVFAEREIPVDLIICSPAKRTRKTAKRFCKQLEYAWTDVVIDKRIYEAPAAAILEVIRGIDDAVAAAMVFGHNPGFTEVANQFSPDPVHNVPTTGIVTMSFDTMHWHRLPELSPVAFDLDCPKNHD